MKRITVETLKAAKACHPEVMKFSKVFPKGAPVSMRSFDRARQAGLNVFWMVRLITGPARAEYEKAIGPARAEYEKARDEVLAEYEKAIGPAWVEYERAIGPAWVEYERAIGPAWVEYERAIGAALVTALLAQQPPGEEGT